MRIALAIELATIASEDEQLDGTASSLDGTGETTGLARQTSEGMPLRKSICRGIVNLNASSQSLQGATAPAGRPVAVYYRQSTEGQIGNISTTLWSYAEREKLRRMVERAATQIELLAALPDAYWRMIRERFVYHFGSEVWRAVYKGKKSKYGPYVRWEDTAEDHQTAHDTQLATSAISSCSLGSFLGG